MQVAARLEWGTSPAKPPTPPGRHELGHPKFGAPPLGIGTALREALDGGFQLTLDISHTTHRVAGRADGVSHGNCPRSADGQATTLRLSGGTAGLCGRQARNAILRRINPFPSYLRAPRLEPPDGLCAPRLQAQGRHYRAPAGFRCRQGKPRCGRLRSASAPSARLASCWRCATRRKLGAHQIGRTIRPIIPTRHQSIIWPESSNGHAYGDSILNNPNYG
jgi:hypothetical protein